MIKNPYLRLISILLALSAYTPVVQTIESTPTPISSEVRPTWTDAVPSQTATPLALPTIAFPTLPAPMGTPLNPTPFVRVPETECFVTAMEARIRIEVAPFISASQLVPTLEPGVAYRAMDIYPTYYQLFRDGVAVGWADYRSLGLSSEGAGCARLFLRPPETRSLSEFPGLCFLTAVEQTGTFQDDALTEPSGINLSPSSLPYVVLWRSRKSIFTSIGQAGPSFYVSADKVSLNGACEGIPTSGTVTTAGWIWSQPDGQQGEKLLPLSVGQRVDVEGIPLDGNRPPDASTAGAWVQIPVENPGEIIFGWVWSGLIALD
jgi:hypothetical protein